ncbi:class II 3-deoxy-7-phosphoheptulonate synthase [Streptomyces sp. NPDC058000]|uniref:class II 3-deoxy-7-phosphoheptulonate synthase n=1 Tax=Streptomyces sp. NPDC058000 TaxID=3346299 RepID=UPI0036EAB063
MPPSPRAHSPATAADSATAGHSAAADSWRRLPAAQQPAWPDPAVLREVTGDLARLPALVLAEECDRLRGRLAAVARGEAFLLHGGDCAETFAGATADAVNAKLRTLLQMAVVLTHGAALPVVKVGRIAGQYAKPRSRPTETRGGRTLPAYRGDAVNGPGFTAAERTPDPRRLRRMYDASAATLNLIRAFTTGGHTSLTQAHAWNRGFVTDSPAGRRYVALADEIERSLRFMTACGVSAHELDTAEFYAGHEGLLLDYEAALTRTAGHDDRVYAGSGHLLWIGERTRALDGAHVEYFSRIHNPIAVKLGPDATADDALGYVDKLNPHRVPGRLTFVVRMGADAVRHRLPDLVEKVTAEDPAVAWVCDPMHGNTFVTPGGHKTRRFDDILSETRTFFAVHRALGTHAGGLHIEFTGDDVTECLGGGDALLADDLHRRYETACDPRLNHRQSLELAFRVAEMLRTRSTPPTP